MVVHYTTFPIICLYMWSLVVVVIFVWQLSVLRHVVIFCVQVVSFASCESICVQFTSAAPCGCVLLVMFVPRCVNTGLITVYQTLLHNHIKTGLCVYLVLLVLQLEHDTFEVKTFNYVPFQIPYNM